MNRDILIFAEQRDGIIQTISYELLSGAVRLAKQGNGRVIAALFGHQISEAARKLSASGADLVITADHPDLAEYLTEPYTTALTEAIRETAPEIVLLSSTSIGMELAARTAARLDTGLVTDCAALSLDPSSGLLFMTRPNLDGVSIDTFICEKKRPQMATVRPGVLAGRTDASSGFNDLGAPGVIRSIPFHPPTDNKMVRLLSTIKGREKNTDISQSRILVAGGRGVGGPKGFESLRAIARMLGGEIACSRACTEAGWIDAAFQVGQTGKTVRPDLYLACGISGAFQHVTGMEGSKLIIAINKSPSAPIFDIADLGIVGNVEVVLPRLTEALKEYKHARTP